MEHNRAGDAASAPTVGLRVLARRPTKVENDDLGRTKQAKPNAPRANAARRVEDGATFAQKTVSVSRWHGRFTHDGADQRQANLAAVGVAREDEIEPVAAGVGIVVGRVCDKYAKRDIVGERVGDTPYLAGQAPRSLGRCFPSTCDGDPTASALDEQRGSTQVAYGLLSAKMLAHGSAVVIATHGDDTVGEAVGRSCQLIDEGHGAVGRFLPMVLEVATENQEIALEAGDFGQDLALVGAEAGDMEIAGENDRVAVETVGKIFESQGQASKAQIVRLAPGQDEHDCQKEDSRRGDCIDQLVARPPGLKGYSEVSVFGSVVGPFADNIGHVGEARSAAQVGDKPLERIALADRLDLDIAVGQIANEALEAEPAGGIAREPAVADPLNPSLNYGSQVGHGYCTDRTAAQEMRKRK